MIFVLYHGNCYDGFGAAWACKKGLEAALLDSTNEIEYIPVFYGQPAPVLPKNAGIYLLDFSYPVAVLDKMAHDAKYMAIIDHHKTAQADLANWDVPANVNVKFDMKHSGAVLTWQWMFNGDAPVPELLKYIEAADIWVPERVTNYEEIVNWIRSFARTFDNYDLMDHTLHNNPEEIIHDGSVIHHFKLQKVQELAENSVLTNWGEYGMIPVVNTPIFMSEVAHELLIRNPESKFAAYWFTRFDKKIQFGLRSRPDFDCSVVAKQFGGGGHAQASGFEIDADAYAVIKAPRNNASDTE